MKKTLLTTLLIATALTILTTTVSFAQYAETFAPRDTSANCSPVAVESVPGDPNDRYVVFEYWGACKPSPGVWATNVINQIQINNNPVPGPGLNGIYECAYVGSQLKTTVKLRVRQEIGMNAWSIRVKW